MTVLSRVSAHLVPVAALVVGISLAAQTPIEPRNNRFSPQEDVKLGREAAAEIRQQLPMLTEGAVTSFVEQVGKRLVAEIPGQFEQPEFRYTFETVNLSDINAFALPGGPMFLHRGMIEAARTDAEVAGVMAHELAHVVLRHGTAQATEAQGPQIGAIAGQILGAIVGGRTGSVIAQGSELAAGVYFLRYSREFEREADLLGAQMMARAGYDPRQMASMFQTIQKQSGARGPEWLSSHPDPGNRAQAITREAAALTIADPANTAGAFEGARQRLAQLPPAQTMEQVARARQKGGQRAPVGTTGRGAVRVEPPATQLRTHQPADFMRIAVPANWEQVGGQGAVTYAPEGGYFRGEGGQSAFTHGVQIGVVPGDRGHLRQDTDALVKMFARSNPQLRRQGGYSRTTIGGRAGLTANLSNVSEVTGGREMVNLSTVQLANGSLLYIVGVAPAEEARTYQNTFARVRQSVQLNDR
jgi:beta-barrel assembly-enhancing protease